jgi:predicted ArsR family transcriptional regulator
MADLAMTMLQRQARALGDPTRHRIFRYVADAEAPVPIAELTAHMGLNHNAIRQHLGKLVDAGLVVESTAPAARPGRPRLVYAIDPAADSRWGVTGPYERLSLLLAEIIRTGETAVAVGRRAGRRQSVIPAPAPREDVVDDLAEAMAREGFEPEVRRRGDAVDIILRNCPFQSTAVADPDTVCSLHLGIAEGLAAGTEGVVIDELVPKDPRRANCRLHLHLEPAS